MKTPDGPIPIERDLARIAGRSDPSVGLDVVIGACASCDRRDQCVPGTDGGPAYEKVPVAHKRLARGEALHRAGDHVTSVFAIRSGYLKLLRTTSDGKPDIVDFAMSGDLVGLDGLGTHRHSLDAVAIETTDVCALAPTQLLRASAENRAAGDQLLARYGDTLRRQYEVLLRRSHVRAETRLASFLIEQSARFAVLGYAPGDFRLRPTRAEIASHLTLSVDSVARALRRLCENGVIRLDGHRVRVLDAAGLAHLAGTMTTSS